MSAPPAGADRLIRRSHPDAVIAATIVGDLHEEYGHLRRRRPALAADLWYWLQALRIAGGYRFGFRAAGAGAGERARRWAGDLSRDLRHGVRGFRHAPGTTLIVVLTLALALGANATMFGFIERLLLSAPPHIAEPDRVVRVNFELTGRDGGSFVMQATSYAVYHDLLTGAGLFDGLAAAAPRDAVLGSGESARKVAVSGVTGNYFETLGTFATLGRGLLPTDDEPPVGNPVAVISHSLWQGRFGGNGAVLGTELSLDGSTYAVVGVAPPGFSGDGLAPIDVWVPIHAAMGAEGAGWKRDRRRRLLTIVGRLADRVTPAAAQQDADRALSAADPSAPAARTALGPLTPGRGPQGTSTQARIGLWLGGVALMVLLVAVANVTNLLVLRTHQRRHELAIRAALGMGRSRMVRQMLAETLLLAAVAAGVALLFASWTSDLLRAVLTPGIAPPSTRLTGSTVAVTSLAALVAALLAGMLPAGRLVMGPGRRLDIHDAARKRARPRLRGALLLAQTSLSVLLLIGAGLFVTSLRNLHAQDLGMRLEGVLLAEIEFTGALPPPERDELYRQALERIRGLPDVEQAIAAQTIPFGPYMTMAMGFPGKDFRALFGDRQIPYYHAVEAPFFEIMKVDIVAGRPLQHADDASAPPVVVISESLARYVWPDEGALGKCMRAGMTQLPTPDSFLDGAGEDVPCYEIVGIASDVAERSLLPEERLTMQWYTTFEQLPPLPPMMTGGPRVQALLIKSAPDAMELAALVQRVVQGLSGRIAFVEVRPYRELIDPGARSWRLGATLFSVFGLLALLIAAVGIYGVFAHAVAERAPEVGVRMALGAGAGDVARLVLVDALRAALAGIGVGGLAALWAGRYLEELLYGTGAWNGTVFAAVALTLMAVAVAATAVPTWRAVRTDPKETLSRR